ncbi:hypothetical protein P3102_20500 [Amycolatopsis sp. QT-25]|nr:hypothetical protein [Amycolatopsis sp. QT-25]WET76509.1 hypothetical protein P3102_20500 [Amycolatopsis sp. QT-25]
MDRQRLQPQLRRLAALRELGVARVSYGPRFYRAALEGFRTTIGKL